MSVDLASADQAVLHVSDPSQEPHVVGREGHASSAGPALARGPVRKLRVLFMHTRSHTSRPFAVHTALMEGFDRSRVESHAVYNSRVWDGIDPAGMGTPVLDALKRIPTVTLRPVDFGPRIGGVSRRRVAGPAIRSAVPVVIGGLRLLAYVRRSGIDIIHSAEGPRDAVYGLVLARLSGARFVMHLHIKYNNWINPLSRWTMRRADGIITISDWVNEGVQRAGVPPERIFTVYNGISVNDWDPAGVQADAVRREFGVASSIALIVIIANLVPWKGHELLLQALRRVIATHPDVKLLVVGEQDPQIGGLVPGSYIEVLRRSVAALSLERHVVFTGQRRDVVKILAAADIFAMPARDEPFGLVFAEAMAMEKPVIALRCAGTPEVVQDGQTGLLSAPEDVDGLAGNIVALLDDAERRREMGADGRRRVLERFTARHMADGVERVYRSLAVK
jgi:glycosyltransferase involved in cell wall biosynthesis